MKTYLKEVVLLDDDTRKKRLAEKHSSGAKYNVLTAERTETWTLFPASALIETRDLGVVEKR